jgi:hypothetical protein
MPLEHRYGETIGQRKLDPRFVSGVASVPELSRVEQAIAALERQAEERAARERNNNPRNLARVAMSKLWRRGHAARQSIVQMQEERLGKKSTSSNAIHWPAELKFFNLPVEFFETPPDIGADAPDFDTLEESDKLSAKLSVKVKAARLEALEGAKNE